MPEHTDIELQTRFITEPESNPIIDHQHAPDSPSEATIRVASAHVEQTNQYESITAVSLDGKFVGMVSVGDADSWLVTVLRLLPTLIENLQGDVSNIELQVETVTTQAAIDMPGVFSGDQREERLAMETSEALAEIPSSQVQKTTREKIKNQKSVLKQLSTLEEHLEEGDMGDD